MELRPLASPEPDPDDSIYLSCTGRADWPDGPGGGANSPVTGFETGREGWNRLSDVGVVGRGAMETNATGARCHFSGLADAP